MNLNSDSILLKIANTTNDVQIAQLEYIYHEENLNIYFDLLIIDRDPFN